MGDEVYHGEGGPPTEAESIYGPVCTFVISRIYFLI